VSLGGEIGEVGGNNSTAEELRAFVEGYDRETAGQIQLAKVSVQTGTRHGGVRRTDGSLAEMALDFETLRELSSICRDRYGMAGAVQHGASTLPEDMFSRFPEAGCAEVHLATGFQDLVLDHPAFPQDLRADMEAWSLADPARERRPEESDAQFVRRGRGAVPGGRSRSVAGKSTGTAARR
jgi:fructose/tagatose bisphosphate aldolase